MADALVADFGWFPWAGDGIGAMQVERGKPAGGSLAITACPSQRMLADGRTGIRIDVRDSYHGGDPDGSTERLLGILRTAFAGAVADADSMVDGLMQPCASPRRRYMAA